MSIYRKAAHFENKIETGSLLDRVIALKSDFREHELNRDLDVDQEEREASILCNRWREIATDIVAFVPLIEADIEVKLKCLVLLNDMEDISTQDRINDADGMHDEIAWSIIRDLVAARPNLDGIELQPRCAEKL
ncbi:hypothetical protein [Methylobacterium sp. Leaf469]|uniref:hypothetical protein n=1 Tax=Methylobacterium sp. Leaf469 TaxID=1736387 RepID=UPI000AF28A35|nr:hypothetical protein [Methylobacterium sp. Leaf469]